MQAMLSKPESKVRSNMSKQDRCAVPKVRFTEVCWCNTETRCKRKALVITSIRCRHACSCVSRGQPFKSIRQPSHRKSEQPSDAVHKRCNVLSHVTIRTGLPGVPASDRSVSVLYCCILCMLHVLLQAADHDGRAGLS